MWFINDTYTTSEEVVMKQFGLKYPPMVKSFLDTDQYKFSMQQCYFHQFNSASAEWDFKARNVTDYNEEDRAEISRQLDAYCALRFTDEELKYLASKLWVKPDYISAIRDWKPHREEIEVTDDSQTGLGIHTHGTQWQITMYEIPILTIAAETYYRNHYNYDNMKAAFMTKTLEKIKNAPEMSPFSEFGTRRRVSFELQKWLVEQLRKSTLPFSGTSNLLLAMKLNVPSVGTMAHEFIMTVGQGYPEHNPAYSNYYALKAWVKEYGTMNGIALTDTIGTEIFRKDFNSTFASIFKGVRHDSGNPYDWGNEMLNMYHEMGIGPKTKVLMFSDSLDFDRAHQLTDYFGRSTNVAFGIGTFLTGAQDVEPLNIVCKVVKVNGLDVAKLSDCDGKCMCRNPDAIDHLKNEIVWRLNHDKPVWL